MRTRFSRNSSVVCSPSKQARVGTSGGGISSMVSEKWYGSRIKRPGRSGSGEGMKSRLKRSRGSGWDTAIQYRTASPFDGTLENLCSGYAPGDTATVDFYRRSSESSPLYPYPRRELAGFPACYKCAPGARGNGLEKSLTTELSRSDKPYQWLYRSKFR